MKTAFPLKLGITVVLVFAALITGMSLWTPLRIRWYLSKAGSQDIKVCIKGIDGLFAIGEKGRAALTGIFPDGETAAQLLIDNWDNVSAVKDMEYRVQYGWTLLHEAAEHGYPNMARIVIGKGCNVDAGFSGSIDINDESTTYVTPLHVASGFGHADVVRVLLEHKAEPKNGAARFTFPNRRFNINALHLAAEGGHLDVVKVLVLAGVDVDVKTMQGNTPLLYAFPRAEPDLIRYLIEKGADVNLKNNYGVASLYVAAGTGDVEAVKLLIENGADVNIAADSGETPLHVAARHESRDKWQFERDRMFESSCESKEDEIEHARLIKVEKETRKKLAQLLIEAGADVNAKATEYDIDYYNEEIGDRTPLHVSCRNGDFGTSKVLIDSSAVIDAQDNNGKTPLHLAVRSGGRDVVKLLLDGGANVNAGDNNGATPLHYVLGFEDDDVDEDYIDGERSESEDMIEDWERYVQRVKEIRNVRMELAKLLLSKGADVNVVDKNGWSVLHHAVEENQRGLVECFVESGADVNMKGDMGLLPLDIALVNDYAEIAEFLKKHGARTEVKQK